MLKIRGKILREDKTELDVDVWINTETEEGKIPDRRGEFGAPFGTTFTQGEKCVLVLRDRDLRALGQPEGKPLHILICHHSGDRVPFLPTSPPE